MESSGAAEKRIKFENPPINELVIALYHLPIVEMKSQHIGIYWDRVREKYPLCQQQSIVVNPFDPQPQPLMEAPGEIFPLPPRCSASRCWRKGWCRWCWPRLY